MASAVIVSQNESSWAHMGKTPYSNPHLNSNPNSNPKKKQKQIHHAGANGVAGRYRNNNNVDSPAVTQTASDDAYSFNQTSTSRNAVNYGSYLTFNVASYNKSELVELRTRLAAELDQIRNLRNRIETGQFNIAENPRSQAKPKKSSGSKRPGAVVGSVPKKLYDGCDNNGPEPVNFEGLLKECGKIVSKLIKHKHGYVFKIPVDAVALGLHDYHSIVKRPMDLGTVKSNLAKNLYRSPSEFAADIRLTFNNALLYNPKTDPVNGMAEQLLARFEELFKPIREKMDGLLNQRGEMDVHEFRANNELPFREVEELQGSSWNNHGNQIISSPIRGKKSKPRASPVPVAQVLKKAERMQTPMRAHSTASTPSNPPQPMNQQALMPEPLPPSPVRATSLPSKDQKVGRGGTFRQPKPRAKDPNKREMNMEEKQKLGLGLQSLPQEKMPQLVQIIRKRNEHLAQDGDEIELDIEALDTETLWELDRFVTNWKKMVSKTKRQALMMSNPPATDVAVPTTPIADAEVDGGSMSEKNDDDSGKKLKDNDDEDVEIDDDMPAESFPPVEIEKDEGLLGGGGGGGGGGGVGQEHEPNGRGNVSSSSSSSGSSSSETSSSSDSDSGSSSGSDSDADDAQS